MSKIKKPEQKIVTFVDTDDEMDKIQSEIDNGWQVVGMYFNGKNYVGILEKSSNEPVNSNNLSDDENETKIYIPARKKLKITY